jgi:hypothetical protein
VQVGPLPPGFSSTIADRSAGVRWPRTNEADPRKSVWLVADPGAVRGLGRPFLISGLSLQSPRPCRGPVLVYTGPSARPRSHTLNP